MPGQVLQGETTSVMSLVALLTIVKSMHGNLVFCCRIAADVITLILPMNLHRRTATHKSYWVRPLKVFMIAALVMRPVMVGSMLPTTYTAAMIGKSCGDFIDLGLHVSAAEQTLHSDIWACQSGRTSQLFLQQQQCCRAVMGVPWLLNSASGKIAHKHMLTGLV